MRPPVAMPLPATMIPGPAASLSRLDSSTVRVRVRRRGAKGRVPSFSTAVSAASCSSRWVA